MSNSNSRRGDGIRDNRNWGTVGDFLDSEIKDGTSLSIVSAYFTIYAFEALKSSLLGIKGPSVSVRRTSIHQKA